MKGARISNLDPYERPDYWRVAIDLFQESPVGGVGTGNFEREYTARRHEPKHSRYVHNMYLRALGEGGAVAAALLVAFFLSLFAAGAMLRRRLAGRAGARARHEPGHGRLLRRAPELRLARGDPGRRWAGVRAAAGGAGGRGAPRWRPAVAARGDLVASGRLGHGGGGRPGARVAGPRLPGGALREPRRTAVERATSTAAFDDLDRARSAQSGLARSGPDQGRIAISARRYGACTARPSSTRSPWRTTGSRTSRSRCIYIGRGHFCARRATELARARALNARDPVLTRWAGIKRPGER